MFEVAGLRLRELGSRIWARLETDAKLPAFLFLVAHVALLVGAEINSVIEEATRASALDGLRASP